MELVATIWDATKCLFDCCVIYAAFICNLKDSLESLKEEWTQLQDLSLDVKTRVEQAERNAYMRRTREVHGWLESVNALEKVIEDILQRGAKVIQVKCMGNFCPMSLSSYNMGREVVRTLDCVKESIAKGHKFANEANIAYQPPRELVDEMPVPETVGMDSIFRKLWDSIEEENVGIVGLYGMGGAGKTTLMKKINNKFAKRSHDFSLVVWVAVSKDRDIDKIMEEIRKKCGIGDIIWKNISINERVLEIYRVMKQKKFILFLDDMWEELELHSVGIPLPNETNQSKILLTTRFENVCDQMHAKKFKVECLTEKEAMELFCIKVGEETLNSHPGIRVLAQELKQKCRGLPLALVTVARAMAGQRNPQAWMHAIKEPKSFSSVVLGMGKEVLFTLKFSYDNLPTETMKKCFLYCALYPEDIKIYVPHLIRLWIGEGLLEEHDSIRDAYNHGESIIENLKLACLLEGTERYHRVKIHDLIRDMALWLARDQDKNKNKVLVQGEALGSPQADNLDKWKITEKISMIYTKAYHWHVPICPNLVTLIVQDNAHIKDFANVRCMSRLKVLSLIDCTISILPPEIGQLIHLEYLELTRMSIKERFPIEMKNLKCLRVFLLHYVDFSLKIIPLEVISSLEKLTVFSFTKREFWEVKSSLQKMRSLLLVAIHSTHAVEKSFLEQLELLPVLEDLSITLETTTGINKLLCSTRFQRCVTAMGLQQYRKTTTNIPLISSMASMEHLEDITLTGFQDNMEMSSLNHISTFRKIRCITISDCHSITHLTWLKYAPLLHQLKVQNCNQVEEVIKEKEDIEGKETMDEIFSILWLLKLWKLPQLKSIYKKVLPLPMLQFINIKECPNLKKLPLQSNSTRNSLKVIRGETQWWEDLEWENLAFKDLFRAKFEVHHT